MDVGMMWLENDPKTPLAAKVQEAAEYYHAKYGRQPNLCLVNPAAFEQADKEPGGEKVGTVTVRPSRSILPGHLWIGVDEKKVEMVK